MLGNSVISNDGNKGVVNYMKILTISETAKRIGIPQQALRCGLKAGKYPFGIAYKSSDKGTRYRYEVWSSHLERWLKGEI